MFLTAMGAEEAQIEASFCAAIKIAREQKSVSLEKRAEATYAEYLRQKTWIQAPSLLAWLFVRIPPPYPQASRLLPSSNF
jgi:hypothetical protein